SNSRARRASEAVQRRLYQEALKVLIDNDEAVDLEPNEARLALDLLIRVGRLDDARALDTEEPFFQFRIAAASGDYDKADDALVRYLDRLKKDNMEKLLGLVLNSTWSRPLVNGQPLGMGPEMLFGLQSPALFVRNWADWSVVRGVLALEAGDQAQAEEHFRQALRLGESPAINTIVVGLYGLRTPLEAATFLYAKHSVPPMHFSFHKTGFS